MLQLILREMLLTCSKYIRSIPRVLKFTAYYFIIQKLSKVRRVLRTFLCIY